MILTYQGHAPRIDSTAFIAPGAQVIGDVEIGPEASIWYNVVLRGDVNSIRIGARSNIQDGSIVHVDFAKAKSPGHPTIIGDDVLIGHLAIVHGCTLHDGAFVGLGAIVMDGCVLEDFAMLAAGAMLTPGKTIPARQLWAGRPAKFLRDRSDAEIQSHGLGIARYVDLGRRHRDALNEQR